MTYKWYPSWLTWLHLGPSAGNHMLEAFSGGLPSIVSSTELAPSNAPANIGGRVSRKWFHQQIGRALTTHTDVRQKRVRSDSSGCSSAGVELLSHLQWISNMRKLADTLRELTVLQLQKELCAL